MNAHAFRGHAPQTRTLTERVAQMAITSTGLRIGIAHQPRPAPTDRDALQVQTALLEPRTAQPLSLMQRVLAAIWRWL